MKIKTEQQAQEHEHNGYSWWEKDYQGIELCKVCEDCVDYKLSKYRPEILTGYSQADVDEPIDEN
jgi:hypothetical protein